MEVGLGPGDFVLDVDPPTPRKKGTPTSTQFLAHVYCGQMAGWIKMLLGTEVNVGSGDVVRSGRSSALKGAQPPPIFDSCLLWPNGWMDEDVTWYGTRPRPRPHCIRRGPSSQRKGHSSPPPSLRIMSIVATVAHLSYCSALVISYDLCLKTPIHAPKVGVLGET